MSVRWVRMIIVLLVAAACADANRDNSVDPINTPVVKLATPVFEAGSILLEWQYYTEGDDLAQFEITRTSEGVSTSLGRIPVTPAGAGWQSASLRDTVFVAGVNVQYQVLALDGGGVITASSSGNIRIGGTVLDLVRDPRNLRIQLTWSDEPPGTTGYEVLRNGEVIFSTDDPTVRAFDDVAPTANTLFNYVVRTLLAGGRAIISDAQQGRLFSLSEPYTPGPIPPASGYLLPQKNTSPSRLALALTEPEHYVLHYVFAQDYLGVPDRITLPDSDPHTWSTAYLRQTNPEHHTVIAGFNRAGNSVFLSVFPAATVADDGLVEEPVETRSWPSTGGTRTGVVWAGPQGSGKILFFEGTTLRVLGNDFEVEDEIQIETGEPLDFDFDSGSIWLAYPDRLVRSNDTFLSEGLTSWETVIMPTGTTVSAITSYFDDKLVVFDGSAAKLHVVSPDGEILMSTDAQGQDVDQGDVGFFASWIHQIDGRGTLHRHRRDGQ
jgi:hypothetical protein